MKKNSAEKTYDQKKFIAEFIGCDCFEVETVDDLSEYDKSIAEINAMIDHNISVGDMEEVSNWRKMLQQTKVAKRRAKRMIESKSRMELALT